MVQKRPESSPKGKAGSSADRAGEDDSLWQQVAKTVKPLPGRREERSSTKSPTPRKAAKTPPSPPAPPTPSAPKATPGTAENPVLRHDAAPGLDKRTAERLKRGKLPIDARIDLHGMTQNDAHHALTAFIENAHQAGRRCVLVITGKGLKDDWSTGVLRQAVPGWLNEAPLRALVLGFSYAAPKDGGSGALYVLVKRKR